MQEVGGTGSITAVQVKGPESDWEGVSNKWGAAWEIAQAPKYPLDIHLTNDQGQDVCCQSPHCPTQEMLQLHVGQQLSPSSRVGNRDALSGLSQAILEPSRGMSSVGTHH